MNAPRRQQRAELLTANDAAMAIGLRPATLRDWARRGILTNHGTRQVALYDPAELVVALDAAKPRRGVTRRQNALGA